MILSSRRAVITGIGVIAPLGLNAATFWEALSAGRSGVRRLPNAEASCFTTHVGAPVEGFDAKKFLDKKDRKRLAIMSRPFQFAAVASRLALQDAALKLNQLDPKRVA